MFAQTGNIFRRSIIALMILATLISLSIANPAYALKERDMVPKIMTDSKASIIDAGWMQIALREQAYNAGNVSNTDFYSITSIDDPDFSAPVRPILVNYRYFPEDGPYTDTPGSANVAHLNEMYRIFLKLPTSKKLKEGKTYTVTVNPAVANVSPLTVKFDAAVPNDVIHVNQVGYIPDGPKVAYLSLWTGQGSVNFADATAFQLIDESVGTAVYSGNVHFDKSGADEKWGESDLYSLDFSSVKPEGKYHLYIPGIGSSYPFKISSTIYNDEIGYTLTRGITMQRDGNHGLDNPNVTHWNRPPAHLTDAIDEATGKQVDLTGGHMDAGDRGKYPWNVAATVSTMLSTASLFPDQIAKQGESLEIPESGNGIPDYLDELAYELDFLYKAVMNTSKDGALAAYIHPSNDGYEQGVSLEGQTGRVFFDVTHGPLKAETLYGAGALAMAYNSPLMQKYFPQKMDGYKQAALKAFQAFETHKDDAAFWKPEDEHFTEGGPHSWSDEMLFAAANLHTMTGESKYLNWITSEMPASPLGSAQKKWGWVNEGPWLDVFLSLYQDTNLNADLRQNAYNAILDWANTAMSPAHEQPYGVPMVNDTYSQVGWYFTGSQIAYPMMIAYGVSHDSKYRDQIVKTWNYLLGSNPLSNSYISGLGDPQRSPHFLTHEISQYQWRQYKAGKGGWSEMVPGIPNADLQDGKFPSYLNDAWNSSRVNNVYPALSDYPALYRYTDTWNTTNEFVTLIATREASSVLPLIPTELYTLTTSADHGTISPSGGSYVKGTTLTLNVTPNLGYKFAGWSGDATGTENPLTVTMDTYKNIKADFVPTPTHTLTINGTHGKFAFDPPGPVYNEGTTVTVKAIADSGYRFTGWGGDLQGTANSTTITMDKDKSVTAQFEVSPTYSLSVNASGGEVLQSPQKSAYEAGEQVTLEAIPDKGYVFDGWSGDVTGKQNPVTVVMDSYKTITAAFRMLPRYSLTLQATQGGTVSPPSSDFMEGSKVTLTATAQPGYVFTGWSGDLSGMANPVDVTMDKNKSITATFQSTSSIISQDLNTVNPGSTTVDNDVYTVKGSGYNFWSAPDAMRYVYEMGLQGNFSIVARLDSMSVENPNGMAGIQLRSGTALNAAYANIFVQNGKLVGRFRKGGDYSDNVASQPVTLPVWMKITRGPNPWNISTFTSNDGVNWTQFTSGDFWGWMDPKSPQLTAGLFVVGGTDDQWKKYTTAQFSHVQWPVAPTSTVAPAITLDQTDGTVTHNPYTLSGSVTGAYGVKLKVNDGAEQIIPVNAGTFSTDISLVIGVNAITVDITDGNGKITASKQLHVTYDQPPQATAYRTATAPNLDGNINDQVWKNVITTLVSRSIHDSKITADANNTFRYGLLWDDQYLYVGADVSDSHVISGKNAFNNDGLEIYVDMMNKRSGWDSSKDSQLAVGPGDLTVTSWRKSEGVIAKSNLTDSGYTVEMAIPWSTFGITPSADMKIGFDIGANDDNTGNGRTGVLMWSGTMDNWKQTDNYGEMNLSAIVLDQTPPLTTSIVSPAGPDGQNGWYVSPVTVSLSASDNQSGVANTVYSLDGGTTWLLFTKPLTMEQDGKYAVSYRSTDHAGNMEDVKTMQFNIDKTAPKINVSSPINAAYSDDKDLTPQFIVTDEMSTVDTGKTQVMLDGRILNDKKTVPLYTLPLGNHTLQITASDFAGNTASVTIPFQTTATITSLKELVTRFKSDKSIDNAGIANSLQKKLDHYDVDGFIEEVRSQSDKHILKEAAQYLLRDANSLQSNSHNNESRNDKQHDVQQSGVTGDTQQDEQHGGDA